MTDSYQEKQQQLKARANQLKEANPYMIARPADGEPIPGGVGANIRKLFQKLWPDVPCRARTERLASGTTVHFEYTSVPGGPSREEVFKALIVFQNRQYQHDIEAFSPDSNFERQAFRKAFGGVGFLTIVEQDPTPQQRQSLLKKSLPAAQRTRKAPRM